MTQVILKNDKVLQNDYFFLDNIANLPKSNTQKFIVTATEWLENKKVFREKKNIGIKLNSDESVSLIKEDIKLFKIIQFNFITFKDGRPFSEARKLRNEYKFTNEIRASGHIIPDQYIFLIRCGFDSVEIESKKKKFWLEFLKMDSGLYYQP
ncbi:MAG: hypothetical protein CL572_04185 [Alphaproteobacteria bacterium]|nr:hypothetical protein [Alphaproteobacteria bacterium]|tara:strand:- start:23 stop:478 length:456 start_codon:yes stop_codon:yes gene_type:complete